MYIVTTSDEVLYASANKQWLFTADKQEAAVYPLFEQALDAMRCYQQLMKLLSEYELIILPWQK